MGWIFGDTFDHYPQTDLFHGKWTGYGPYSTSSAFADIVAGNGRRSTAGVTMSGSFGPTHSIYVARTPGDNTAIVGCAFYTSSLTWQSPILTVQVANSSPNHISVMYMSDGSLQVRRGTTGNGDGTILGTSDLGIFFPSLFQHIQMKAIIHDTNGYVEVRLNGSLTPCIVVPLGTDTNNGGANVYSAIRLGGRSGAGSGYHAFDDFYWCDGTGPLCNDFLGDIRGTAKLGTANGAMVGWTPNTGLNYAAVDDATPDGDTTFNAVTTAPATDTFIMPPADLVSDILVAVTNLYVKKADSGTAMVTDVLRVGGVDYPHPTPQAPSTSYSFMQFAHMVNPATGLRMTAAEWNAIEAGYKKTA